MKKKLLIFTSILLATAVSGQNTNDALRVAQSPYVVSAALFSQNFYEGTARTAAMGNAFISLGGDIGALSINPASSAVYKYSEFSITPSVNGFISSSDYLNNISNSNSNSMGISSLGYVGYLNKHNRAKNNSTFNIAFAINKLNNFNSRFSASGTTDQSSWLSTVAYGADGYLGSELDMGSNDGFPFNLGVPWRSVLAYNAFLIDPLPDSDDTYFGATENLTGTSIAIAGDLDQSFTRETSGSLSEFVINAGGGIGNRLFYGINLGIQSLNFRDIQIYQESAVNPALFNSGFDNLKHTYDQSTIGIGVNAKFGLIYIPVNGLRFGATVSTPTFMTITDEWDETLESNFTTGNPKSYTKSSPIGKSSYNLISPFRAGLGISYVIKTFAILSADFEGVGFNFMSLNDSNDDNAFDGAGGENETIRDDFRFAKNIRLGVEIKPLPQLALRAGYAFYQSPETVGLDNNLISIGAGINTRNGFFGDFAIIHKIKSSEDLKLYANIPGMNSPTGSLETSAYRLMLTFGFRF